MNEEKKSLKSNFVGRSNIKHEGEKSYSYFGIERNNKVVRRFKLLFRSGKQISIPYAFLPVMVFEHDGLVRIKTSDLNISIRGRGLKPLEEYLSNETVRWIKESASNRDARNSADFISDIIIEGDMDL